MTAAVRVLVVDDEPNVRLVFRTTLAAEGYEVVEAADGVEALARLAAARVGVALLDLRMPELDGLATLRRLRQAGDDTPVVIVTAHGSIPDAVEAMRLGAIDFLSKPVTPDQLRKVVADVLARHAEAAPAAPAEAPARGPTVVTIGPSVLDLSKAKLALNRREFDTAARLLDEALSDAPDSAEALTLKGVLLETQGQNHSAYHSYREALDINPNYTPALDNLRRYCLRNGLDADNPRINPRPGGRTTDPAVSRDRESDSRPLVLVSRLSTLDSRLSTLGSRLSTLGSGRTAGTRRHDDDGGLDGIRDVRAGGGPVRPVLRPGRRLRPALTSESTPVIPVLTVLAAWLVIYLIDSAIPGPSPSDVPRPADPAEATPSLPEAHAPRAPHFRRLVPRA